MVYKSLSGVEERCLKDSADDSERFVSCMNIATDKMAAEEKRFEFRMAFLQNDTFNCFKAMSSSGKYNLCKDNANNNLKRYIHDFVTSISS